MNEKHLQVKKIIQAVELGFPKEEIIHLLKILEVYVADDKDLCKTRTATPERMKR